MTLESGYYLIENVDDLKLLENFGTTDSLKFRLASDLDLTAEADFYIPYFNSEIDGSSYEISNLNIDLSSTDNLGLIGVILPSGKIENLDLVGVDVVGAQYVGGLAGVNRGNVSNVYTSGSVTGTYRVGGLIGSSSNTVSDSLSLCTVNGEGTIGGLIGENEESGTIIGSHWEGTLTASSYAVGGLAGINSIDSSINNCFSSGTIIGGSEVGGFVGINEGMITNSHSDANFTIVEDGVTEYSGGFVGFNDEGTIDTCYSTGDVIGMLGSSGSYFVGGFVGYNKNRDTGGIFNSFTTSYVVGEIGVGGLVGFNDEGVIVDSYSLGSIVGDEHVGGLTGYDYESDITNSYYDYETVRINGVQMVTNGAIDQVLFNDWLNNGKTLNIDDYLEFTDGYYIVSTVDNLKKLLAFGENPDYNFKLTENLDLSGDPRFYLPKFRAEINGQGHIISNIYVDLSFNATEPAGFIGELSSEGIITNLGLRNVEFYGGRGAGGLIGYNYGEISNVYTTGLVDAEWYLGGIAGGNWDGGTIANSYSVALVGVSGGGLVGSGTATNVTNSFWDIDISGTSSSSGGTGKTSLEMQSIGTYTTLVSGELDEEWDIVLIDDFDPLEVNTWYIRENSDYPRLYGEYLVPVCNTFSATNVIDESATLNGNLESLGEKTEVYVFFQYREIGSNWISTPKVMKEISEDFSFTVENLKPNVSYEYRTVVEYGLSNFEYGQIKTFKTKRTVVPTIVITDIGLINNVPDRDSLTYYFTSTVPKIKGTTQSNSTVSFEYDNETFTTQANSDGEFSITLTVDRGENNIEYYSTDVSGNSSVTKELILIVGTEYFPDWLLEKLGLIDPPEEEIEEEPIEDSEEEVEEDIEEEEDSLEENAVDENTPPTSNTRTIKFTDDRGNPLTKAVVEIEGKRYVTDSNGMIAVEGLEDRAYSAEIRTRDGKNYNTQILGAEQGDIVVEIEGGNSNIRFIYIFLFGGIGLLIIIILVVLMKKNKSNKEAF
jgi:hypothetical protein